jgi:hypothetical protein
MSDGRSVKPQLEKLNLSPDYARGSLMEVESISTMAKNCIYLACSVSGEVVAILNIQRGRWSL